MAYHFIKTQTAFDEAINNIEMRAKGEVKPISTGWPGFDQTYFDGLEEGWIVCIGGKSGSGKTAFATQMLHQMSLNNDFPIAYMVFSFEMRPARMLKRMICYHYGMTMRELYSVAKGNDKSITMDDIKRIAKDGIPFLNETTTFVERPLYPDNIKDHVHKFNEQVIEKYGQEIPIVMIVDHLLLSKGALVKRGIDELILAQNELKKELPHLLQIDLSQLNRQADAPERTNEDKPLKHYPIKSDLYGSDMIFQTCDSVIVLQNPSKEGLEQYGPEGYPTTHESGYPRIFAHHLKNRDAGDGESIGMFEFIGKHYKFKEIYDYEIDEQNDKTPF